MLGYRNEVYHVGLKHESLLPALAPFYFDVACDYLSSYKPKPGLEFKPKIARAVEEVF